MSLACRQIVLWMSIAAVASLGVGRAHADDVVSRYCEQLRKRRLFSLVEGYCLDRLASPTLSLRNRTLLTLELSRSFVEHSKFTSGHENADLIARATEVIDELLASESGHPQRLLLRLQRALVPARHGAFLRWEAQLSPGDERKSRLAEETLADAVLQLRDLEIRLLAHGRGIRRSRDDDDELPAYELRQLTGRLRYELGRAVLERARLLPASAPDRAGFLIDAETWLKQVPDSRPDEQLAWNTDLALADCSLLRGDGRRAEGLLKAIEEKGPPGHVLDTVKALQVQILLDEDKAEEALPLLINYRRQRTSLPGELQFWKTRAIVDLWEMARREGDTRLADDWLKELLRHVDRTEREIGGYWGYRCRLLVELSRETSRLGGPLAFSKRKAEALYHAGQIDLALQAYGSALDLADRQGRPSLALDLGYTRASIQFQAGRFDEAAEGLRDVIDRFPKQKRTAEAHLLWAYCLGKLYEESPTDARLKGGLTRRRSAAGLAAYARALQAHRQLFAGENTFADATWMLALVEEQRLQHTRALALYLEVPRRHARLADAQLGAARCYEAILERIRRDVKQPADEWELKAVQQLGRFVRSFPPEADPLSLRQSEVCMRLARIHLNRSLPSYEQADRLLRRVVASAPYLNSASPPSGRNDSVDPYGSDDSADSSDTFDASDPAVPSDSAQSAETPAWKELIRMSTQLRIVSLAGQRRLHEAEAFVRALSDTGVAEMLSILDGLMQIAENADEATRRGLGELQLRAAKKLEGRSAELTPHEVRRLSICLAQAYLATNQPSRAIEAYEALIARDPRDRELLKTAAELLLECATNACLTKAKTHWRRLTKLEERGSVDWLNAQYHVALCSFRLKQFEESGKILRVMKILYPERGGPKLRARFEDLQRAVDDRLLP